MSDAEIAGIFLQLVEGLRYLRSVGVVHRDFKTANIFLSGNVAKIADFGLAKFYKYLVEYVENVFMISTSDHRITCHLRDCF
jgi:protein kinase